MIIAILLCFIFVYYKNKAEKRIETQRVVRRSSMGKKGYGITDEKEDDSDSEEELSIDYAKPTLN